MHSRDRDKAFDNMKANQHGPRLMLAYEVMDNETKEIKTIWTTIQNKSSLNTERFTLLGTKQHGQEKT
jgi:hypothetical protein